MSGYKKCKFSKEEKYIVDEWAECWAANVFPPEYLKEMAGPSTSHDKVANEINSATQQELLKTGFVGHLHASDIYVFSKKNSDRDSDKLVLLPWKPCGHPGCLLHEHHPCKKCGRVKIIYPCENTRWAKTEVTKVLSADRLFDMDFEEMQ